MGDYAKTKTGWAVVAIVAAISLSILAAGALVKTGVQVEAKGELAELADVQAFVASPPIRQTTGSWYYLEGDYTPADLGPGDFTTDHPNLGQVTTFTLANGTAGGEGDPNGLFLRFIRHPGYVYLLGPTGTRWAYYEFGPDSITNNGRSFTFKVSRVLDTQIARFTSQERVWFDFHFWPVPS